MNVTNDWNLAELTDDRGFEFIRKTALAIAGIKISPFFHKAVQAISACEGKVITVGLGKAGCAARKVASSLSSLGIPSLYLHPGEASHGDIGVVSSKDVMLVFSTSGKTREVLETVSFAKKLGISSVISITSHKDADIRALSDIVIDMGEIEEAGYLNIAPTTSIIVMLVIADILAVICAEIRGFKMTDYADRHHGGYLGVKSRGEINDNSGPRQ
jgi:arabinose-5-phosphate isomerase